VVASTNICNYSRVIFEGDRVCECVDKIWHIRLCFFKYDKKKGIKEYQHYIKYDVEKNNIIVMMDGTI
jgi:hypothetical protein